METNQEDIGVLLVDDDFIKSDGMFNLYKEIGNMVAQEQNKRLRFYKATNGQEAVELFRKHHPKLIISDYQMPVMDGLIFLETIASELNSTDFNFTTSCQDDGLDKEVERLGGKFYLKPLNVSTLMSLYQEALSQDNS